MSHAHVELPTAQQVLAFWFGPLGPDGCATPEVAARWFTKDPAFDRQIRERFLDLHLTILRGECDSWRAASASRLACVIVLDQFSRNMFRDTLLAFAADQVALQLALEGIDHGHDRELEGEQRSFMYLPLMHAEDLAIQEECVRCFAQFRDEAPATLKQRLGSNHEFALRHRDIVARFGRFPHRNRALGRTSTTVEQAFLAQPGSGF